MGRLYPLWAKCSRTSPQSTFERHLIRFPVTPFALWGSLEGWEKGFVCGSFYAFLFVFEVWVHLLMEFEELSPLLVWPLKCMFQLEDFACAAKLPGLSEQRLGLLVWLGPSDVASFWVEETSSASWTDRY